MERIGHYRIVEEMGRGGMGVVYKGYEESLSRYVAIKVLGEHLTRDPLFVKRFQREAQAAARISHPHIVPVYFVGEDGDRHYFAMEYLTGGSLENELGRGGRIEPLRAAKWMLETARGLAAAHAEGLIHRDIKPANLMLDREGHVKIGDFGLAKATTQATRLTGTGFFLGSPGYLSPEQCRGEVLDGRSDIYSLGVTFYELLSGQIPFSGDSPAALVLNIIQSEPPAIENLNSAVDGELRRILGRMMAKDRDARYPSARELVQALDAYVLAGARGGLADTVAAAPTRLRAGTEPAATVAAPAPTELVAAPGPQVAAVTAEQAVEPAEAQAAVVSATPTVRRSSRLVPLVASLVIAGILIAGAAGWALWSWMRDGVRNLGTDVAAGVEIAALLDDGAIADAAAEPGAEHSAPDAAMHGGDLDADTDGGEDAISGEPIEGGNSPSPVAASTGEVAEAAAVASAAPETIEPVGTDRAPATAATANPAPAMPVTRAAAGSVAVVALGEPLMAGLGEAYVEERLRAHGHTVVDEKGTAAGLMLFEGEQDPSIGSVLELLRPRVERLVLIEVEYLGDRPLAYLDRADVAYRSRVSIRALDLASGVAMGEAVEEDVEYTHLNASQSARKALGAAVRRFLSAF